MKDSGQRSTVVVEWVKKLHWGAVYLELELCIAKKMLISLKPNLCRADFLPHCHKMRLDHEALLV